jgi:hypothetical protein
MGIHQPKTALCPVWLHSPHALSFPRAGMVLMLWRGGIEAWTDDHRPARHTPNIHLHVQSVLAFLCPRPCLSQVDSLSSGQCLTLWDKPSPVAAQEVDC